MQKDHLELHTDIVIGYRFPRGGRPLVAVPLSRGKLVIGYGVIEPPAPGKSAHSVRYGITGGKLCDSIEAAETSLREYAERLQMVPVYVNIEGEECGTVQEGKTALDSVQAYIAELLSCDDLPRASRLQRALNASLTLPEPAEVVESPEDAGTIFVLHFNTPYKNATHYLGFVPGDAAVTDLLPDETGDGRLTEALTALGDDGWALTWEKHGTREEFTTLQKRRNHARLCPTCKGGKS